MRVEILEVLEGHFGKDKDITVDSHMMDDLGGDEFDIVDVFVQIESKLGISIPEEETFDPPCSEALQRRGPARVQVGALCAEARAFRHVREEEEAEQHQALRASRLHL